MTTKEGQLFPKSQCRNRSVIARMRALCTGLCRSLSENKGGQSALNDLRFVTGDCFVPRNDEKRGADVDTFCHSDAELVPPCGKEFVYRLHHSPTDFRRYGRNLRPSFLGMTVRLKLQNSYLATQFIIWRIELRQYKIVLRQAQDKLQQKIIVAMQSVKMLWKRNCETSVATGDAISTIAGYIRLVAVGW
jgi:hypothetical protein